MKRKFLKVFSLALVLALLLTACGKDKTEEEVREDYTPVEVEKITRETLKNPRSFKGKVVSNEEVLVIPKLMGTVSSLNVKLGDKVQEGQVLFTLDDGDIRRSLEQADIAVDLAQKGVRQAENGLATVRINRTASEENMLKSKLDLERMEVLYKEGAIAKTQLEQAKLAFLSADSQLKTVDSQILQGEISLEQAQDQLNQALVSKNQVLDKLEDARVTAPLSGIVSSLDVKLGQMVANGQASAVIVDNSRVYIEVEVIESLVNKLSQGQKVSVKIPAALDGDLASSLDYVSPTADPASKLYKVRAYIDNSKDLIRPGMTGEIKLTTDEIKDTIALPRELILNKDQEYFVFVVEDNKAVKRPVSLGEDFDDYIEIKSGLSLGDDLIVKGQNYVVDGKEVKIMGGK